MADERKIGLNNLKPAKGSTHRRKRVGRGEGSGSGKTSGRGHKGAGQRAGAKSRPNFEGGQMPIHMRMRKLRGPHMKKSMPFEKFRTHTQPVNVKDLEERFDKGAEVTPDALRGGGPGQAPRHAGQDPRHGRAEQGAHRARPRLLRHRAREDRGRRRHRRSSSRTSGVLKTFLSSFRVPEIRKKIAFTAAMLLLYRVGAYIPAPGINVDAVKDISENFTGLQRPRLPQPLLRRLPAALRDLRARDHALHHRLDHPAADDGGGAVAREAPQGGRGRPAEDHAVHPLPHRRAWRSASRSATSSSSAASPPAAPTWSRTSPSAGCS